MRLVRDFGTGRTLEMGKGWGLMRDWMGKEVLTAGKLTPCFTDADLDHGWDKFVYE